MTSSLLVLAVYAALLVLVVLAPYRTRSLYPARLVDQMLCAALFAGAIILTIARQDMPLLGMALLIPLVGLGAGSLLGGITALLLFAATAWWLPAFRFPPVQAACLFVLALSAASLPRWPVLKQVTASQPRLLRPMLLCAALGLFAGLLTAPFETADPFYTLWHHWSALLAPVEAWRGGGMPYRDFPIQYGLGPTTLLMASCGSDCWRGLYYVTVVANALYFATLSGCAIILTAGLSRGVRWLALLAMFCAAFLWTGFPSMFSGPVITPAVAGLRFLFISALLLHILIAEQRQIRWDWIGHAIWLIALFWSPEAGFFTTVIWWPYLALRDASEKQGLGAALSALVRGALRGVLALGIGICCLGGVLWLLSGGSVTAEDFFAYVQHPPGMLPINPTGTIWIALASLALAIPVMLRHGLSAAARPLYVCLLGFMAASVYYLSRSHDNNILNLFPLLILVLLGVLPGSRHEGMFERDFARSYILTALAAMVAFVAAFNWAPWIEGATRAGPLTIGPARLLARLTPQGTDEPATLSADAVACLDYLRSRNAGMVMLLDDRKVIPRPASGTAWTSVNNVGNFESLPVPMMRRYVERGARAYGRAGWILVGPGYARWVDAFRSAYDVRDQKTFGRYRAYYLVPRSERRGEE